MFRLSRHLCRAILIASLLVPFSGCRSLAGFAHRCGCWLDHSSVCDPNLGHDCALCRPPTAAPGPPANALPPPQVVPASTTVGVAPSLAVQDELDSIRAEADKTRKLVEDLRIELVARNAELIETRADSARVKDEIQSIRHEFTVWQRHMDSLHQKLRQQDAQRQLKLAELAGALQQLIDERSAERRNDIR